MLLSLLDLLGMWLRGTPTGVMRRCVQRAEAASLSIPASHMEAHLLARGDLERVLDAVLLARAESIEVDGLRFAAVDLAGGDPRAVVERAVPSKRINWDAELQSLSRLA